MEDLTPYTRTLPAQIQPEQFNNLSKALSKVKIDLSAQQYKSLAILVTITLVKQKASSGVFNLSDLREMYMLSEKMKRKMLSIKSNIRLSLNMSEAAALYTMLDEANFADYAVYENNLAYYIVQEIDKQTV